MLVVKSKKNDLPLFYDFVDDFFGGYGVNGLFNSPLFGSSKNVNIEETENSYEITMELPGFSKKDIKIEIENGLLTISSEVDKKEEQEQKKFIRKSFTRSSFKSSYMLAEDVDTEKIEASLENGLLNVSIGRIKQIEEKPQIKIIEIK